MDSVMEGQLLRYEHDLTRWGYPKDQIISRVEAKKLELETLRLRPRNIPDRPIASNHRDPTFGKFPWLPLCDVY